jgi:hypothetical protein
MVSFNFSTRGYRHAAQPDPVDAYAGILERRLFRDNIQLLLDRYATILAVPDYFFTPLSFGHCWVGMPGIALLSAALRLGHLLIGWHHGILSSVCSNCAGKQFVTAFGGNLNSEIGWSEGVCLQCLNWNRDSSPRAVFYQQAHVMSRIVRRYAEFREEVEGFAGYEFSWSGDGLKPADKTRTIVRRLHNAVPLDVVIYDLRHTAEELLAT